MAADDLAELLSPELLKRQRDGVAEMLSRLNDKIAREKKQRDIWMTASDARLAAIRQEMMPLVLMRDSLNGYLARYHDAAGSPDETSAEDEPFDPWTTTADDDGATTTMEDSPVPLRSEDMRGPSAAYWLLRDAEGREMPNAEIGDELVGRGWLVPRTEGADVGDAVRTTMRRAHNMWPNQIVTTKRGHWRWKKPEEEV